MSSSWSVNTGPQAFFPVVDATLVRLFELEVLHGPLVVGDWGAGERRVEDGGAGVGEDELGCSNSIAIAEVGLDDAVRELERAGSFFDGCSLSRRQRSVRSRNDSSSCQ